MSVHTRICTICTYIFKIIYACLCTSIHICVHTRLQGSLHSRGKVTPFNETASNSVCHSLARLRQLPWVKVGRDSSVGIATCYGLDGPGIESVPIPVAELSKARVCGRSIAGVAGSNPPWGHGCLCCVLHSKDKKAKCKTITTKKEVRMKYEQSRR
jgi:hypothetical protein